MSLEEKAKTLNYFIGMWLKKFISAYLNNKMNEIPIRDPELETLWVPLETAQQLQEALNFWIDQHRQMEQYRDKLAKQIAEAKELCEKALQSTNGKDYYQNLCKLYDCLAGDNTK